MNILDYGHYYHINWNDNFEPGISESLEHHSIYIPHCKVNSKEDLLAIMPPKESTWHMFISEIQNGCIVRDIYSHYSYIKGIREDFWHVDVL